MKHVAVLLLACGLMFLVTGCSKDDIDEGKSVKDFTEEIKNMDKDALRAKALKLKEAIEDKMKEMAKLQEKLPKNATDLLSEDTKNLNSDIDKIKEAIKPLKEKLLACIDQLKEKKGDVSGLEIKTD